MEYFIKYRVLGINILGLFLHNELIHYGLETKFIGVIGNITITEFYEDHIKKQNHKLVELFYA